jgi:acetyl-CoA carboxylase biotin carboxyl carrier protein
MDITEIKRLIKLVESSKIEELELREKGFQIRISKSRETVPVQTVTSIVPQAPAPQETPPAQHDTNVLEAKVESIAGQDSENLVEIHSPMVGTFYRAPAPDAKPYTNTGDEIHPGKILCIVEAMKLMNEIEAEISGKIVKILVENAQPVEYNTPLFLVEKS